MCLQQPAYRVGRYAIMIKQVFNVEEFWEVIVFYNVDYDLFYIIEKELLNNEISQRNLNELYHTMYFNKAKAVTYSNLNLHTSVVLFNVHEDKADYIDSLVHEAEHIKQAMLYTYRIEDSGEPPAYTIGYLVRRMWEVFSSIVCNECFSK